MYILHIPLETLNNKTLKVLLDCVIGVLTLWCYKTLEFLAFVILHKLCFECKMPQ